MNIGLTSLTDGLNRLAIVAKAGTIPGGFIENGILRIDRLSVAVPAKADALVLDLYRRLPDVRITDMLLDVEKATGFQMLLPICAQAHPAKTRSGF